MTTEIIPIKVLKDNYTYLLIDSSDNQAAVIDPGEAGPVINVLNKKRLSLKYILLTHHHFDHSGGVKELKKTFPNAQIAIHKDDARQLSLKCDLELDENSIIDFSELPIKILHLPCHTRGHVAFFFNNALFTGDTLFNAGCGKFFEGTSAEMLKNLNRIKKLPETTKIYCGHEYTVENLEYARQADQSNQNLEERLHQITATTEENSFIPALLSLELKTNPFLRLDDKNLQKQLKTENEIDTMSALYKIYYNELPTQ